jgi:hypothetical protein
MDVAADLLSEIEAFMRAQRMPATRFGLSAVNDGHLVRRLRAGGAVTSDTITKVRRFIAAQTPLADCGDPAPSPLDMARAS